MIKVWRNSSKFFRLSLSLLCVVDIRPNPRPKRVVLHGPKGASRRERRRKPSRYSRSGVEDPTDGNARRNSGTLEGAGASASLRWSSVTGKLPPPHRAVVVLFKVSLSSSTPRVSTSGRSRASFFFFLLFFCVFVFLFFFSCNSAERCGYVFWQYTRFSLSILSNFLFVSMTARHRDEQDQKYFMLRLFACRLKFLDFVKTISRKKFWILLLVTDNSLKFSKILSVLQF